MQNNGTDKTSWDYVYFGSYPQTELTGDSLTASIIGANYNTKGDAWIDGTKYRRISKKDTNGGNEAFGDQEYRYFKWERIKWRVLQNDGQSLFVVADKGLDCRDFDKTSYYRGWRFSYLRTWLNDSFYSNAFTINERKDIIEQTVKTGDNPTFGTHGGHDTQDNIYLLSFEDVTNPLYGFCENIDVSSASRWMSYSDYAYALGVKPNNNAFTGGNNNCCWWLRSGGFDLPHMDSCEAAKVDYDGYVSQYGYVVVMHDMTVVPALHISLDSEHWYAEDDGTSGEGGEDQLQISLDTEAETLTVGDPLILKATVSPSAGSKKKLKWSSSDPEVASVFCLENFSDTGHVMALKAGTATIMVEVAEGRYANAICEVTVEEKPEETIKVSEIILDNINGSLIEGDTLKLNATVNPSDADNKELDWSSSDNDIAIVDATGLVTAVKEGTATITATSTDGSDISASCVITVEKKPEETVKVSGITLDKSSSTLTEGDTLKLAAVVTPANATNQSLSWSSSDTTTATVDAAGLVTAVKTGTATITATSTDGSNISASCVITVEKAGRSSESQWNHAG